MDLFYSVITYVKYLNPDFSDSQDNLLKFLHWIFNVIVHCYKKYFFRFQIL